VLAIAEWRVGLDVKKLLKVLAFLPLRLAKGYAALLSSVAPGTALSWRDEEHAATNALTSTVVHNNGGSDIRMTFATPNALCRFRAASFSYKEPETLQWIDKYGGSGAFFDIGANVGLYSIYYAMSHPNTVYSFEPSVLNLALLARNIGLNNKSDQVTIVPNPLTSHNLVSDMQLTSLDAGGAMSTFGELYGHDGKPIEQLMRYATTGYSLDFLLTQGVVPEPPALIKIDVDGIEHLILGGAVETLKCDSIRSILIEVNDVFALQANAVDALLRGANFALVEKRHSAMFEDSEYSTSYNQIWVRSTT
jgi:FkbM family methyltransferase